MKPLDKTTLENQRRRMEELTEKEKAYRQGVLARLQEAKSQRKQKLHYRKDLDHHLLKNGHLEKLTILHSNDLHGDFLAENAETGLIGGISLLSGYINKVRNEEDNAIYAIAGDMFRGSLIDSEFKGVSTIEIINLMAPDVVTLGNHEVDYGLTHLLFLEKCANFPIINANMYIKLNGARLVRSHIVLEVGGLRILFIGVLTEDVLESTKTEGLVGTLVDIQDAADEVGRITDAYRTGDIDLTVLLTHIGFEEDKKLAAALNPDSAVDIIIGGHSHTYMEEPCVVAGIPIVQAAIGTAQIGRFDILYDAQNHRIDSYTWELIPITEDRCPRDEALEELVGKYKNATDSKYARVLTRFPRAYTHPHRNMETELGDLMAEGMRSQLDVNLVLLASGSIRKPSLGPIVTLQDFMETFPFLDAMIGFRMTGAQLRKILMFMLREEAFDEANHCEWYQFSDHFFCEYDRGTRKILKLTMFGKDVQDEDIYDVAMQGFHFLNMEKNLGISIEEMEENGPPVEVAALTQNVLKEFLSSRDYIKADGEPRFVIHDP